MEPEYEKFLENRDARKLPYCGGFLIKRPYDAENDVIYHVNCNDETNRVGIYSYVRHKLIAENERYRSKFDGTTHEAIRAGLIPYIICEIEKEMANANQCGKFSLTIDDVHSELAERLKNGYVYRFYYTGEPSNLMGAIGWNFAQCFFKYLRMESCVFAFNHSEEFVREMIKTYPRELEEACVIASYCNSELERIEKAGEPYETLREIYRAVSARGFKTVTVAIVKKGKCCEVKTDPILFKQIPNRADMTWFDVDVLSDPARTQYQETFGYEDDRFEAKDIEWIKSGSRFIYRKETK